MSCDALCKNTLAPLVLRLALAAIFIYHGVEKVAKPENEAGAAWANVYWAHQASLPQSVVNRVQDEIPEANRTVFMNELRTAYGRTVPDIPSALRYQAAQLAVAWGELIGGVVLLFGFLTRLAALGEIVIQVGAVYWVTWAQGFSFARGGGYEYNLVLLSVCLALLFTGGGYLAVDHFLFRARPSAHKAVTVGQPSALAGQPVQHV